MYTFLLRMSLHIRVKYTTYLFLYLASNHYQTIVTKCQYRHHYNLRV